ncbi:helix-turn-helix transcriptional regulator [Amycolatopsis suaedae]|nr:YafY family protein [Amycolatopsis suaedae]
MLELLSLLQTGRSWPAQELADRLGTTSRTLRRDLDRLRELGYPVESTRGPGGSYRLAAGRAMPPLVLTDDEAVATTVGLRMAAAALAGGATEGAADGALAKLERVLPPRLRRRVSAVAGATEAVTRRSVDLTVVDALAMAAHAHRHVCFGYTDRAGTETDRHVEPYRQVLLDRHWYLLAWDLDRAGWRTFRLDRITGVEATGSTFTARPLPATMVHRTGEPAGPRGVILFAAPLGTVSARLHAHAGELEAVDATTCRYTTPPDDWEWLAAVIAAVGVPYRVESPPGLRAATRRLARHAANAVPDQPR